MLSKVTFACLWFACSAGLLATPPAALAQDSKPAAGEAVTLKPAFKPGQVYKFTYHIERTDTNTIGGAGPNAGAAPSSSVTADADMSVSVKTVSESGYALDLKVDAIRASAKLPSGESSFDSSKPEDDKDRNNPSFQAFKPLVGMVLTLVADSSGVITSVEGEPAVPLGSLAPTAVQFFANSDYLKFRWNNALIAKRDGAPVKPGDSWSQTDVFMAPQVGRFEQTIKRTLKSVKDGIGTIDGTGDIKVYPAKEGAALAFEIKDTSILATSTWDVKDGLSRSLQMKRNFTLDGSAQGIAVTRKSEETFSITRVE